jgi:uncharacterized membrane protein SirB2
MFHLILAGIGLIVVYRFLVMCFWVCAWLATRALLLVLYLLGAIIALASSPVARAVSPPQPSNVIQFKRKRA